MNTEPAKTEDLLRSLDADVPTDLYRTTVVHVGAADSVATTDSPIGPVWISWSTRGVTALSPLFATATIEEFFERHRREAYKTGGLPTDLADVDRRIGFPRRERRSDRHVRDFTVPTISVVRLCNDSPWSGPTVRVDRG
jgi:hypothetical protein